MSTRKIRVGLGVPWQTPAHTETKVVGVVTRTPREKVADLPLLLIAVVPFTIGLIMAGIELVRRGGRDIRQLIRQAVM